MGVSGGRSIDGSASSRQKERPWLARVRANASKTEREQRSASRSTSQICDRWNIGKIRYACQETPWRRWIRTTTILINCPQRHEPPKPHYIAGDGDDYS